MSVFLKDLRLALRSLAKKPAYAALAIATMALGLGAATAVYGVFDVVLLSPLPFPDSDRLMVLYTANPPKRIETAGVSAPEYRDYREQLSSFEALELWTWYGLSLNRDGRPRDITTLRASPGLLATLGTRPFLGRTFRPDEAEESRVVVMSHGLWASEFGADPGIIGRSVRLDEEPWTVVGVMPAGFQFPSAEVKLWIPYSTAEANERLRFWSVLGRLKPGVTEEQARREAETVSRALETKYPDTNAGFVARIASLKERTVGTIRASLVAVLVAVGLFLLIACANVTNLTLARGLDRSGQLAARTALGAPRGRLLSLLLAESTLLALLGGVLGVALAAWGVEALSAMAPPEIPRSAEIALSPRVLAVAGGLILLAGPLFGLLPAFQLSGRAGATISGNRSMTGARAATRARRALTIAQLALSLVLLAGAGLMIRSLWKVFGLDPGFEPKNAVAVQLFVFGPAYEGKPEAWRQFARSLESGIAAIPGVTAVGTVNALPLSPIQGGSREVEIEGRAEPEQGRASFRVASPGALSALGRRLVAGRNFTADDRDGGALVALLSKAAVRAYFGDQNPLGASIRVRGGEKWAQVVGVVADVRAAGLERTPDPEVIFPFEQQPFGVMSVVVRAAGNLPGLLEAVQREVWKVDAEQPVYRASPLTELVRQDTARRRFFTTVLALFAFFALLLASIGIYGVVSYSVAQRLREIAVRMALGANPAEIRQMVLRDGAILAAGGLALGLILGIAGARAVSSMLFEIPPTDPATFLVVTMVLAAVALSACLVPAFRAAGVAPFTLLRQE